MQETAFDGEGPATSMLDVGAIALRTVNGSLYFRCRTKGKEVEQYEKLVPHCVALAQFVDVRQVINVSLLAVYRKQMKIDGKQD
jgi:hypothetical protein